MPQQKPKPFDPNEFSTLTFDPKEFDVSAKLTTGVDPSTQIHQPVAQPAEQPSQYKSFWDSVASYVPQSVKTGWDIATKPLSDYMTVNSQKIFDPKAAADYYDTPSDTDTRIPFTGGATWKGLGAGLLEGAGNVLSGLTSPLNLATMGSLKGASSLAETAPTVARGLNLVSRAASAPVAAHGAISIANPNTSMGEKAFGVAELAGGLTGMRAPEMPVRREDAPIAQMPPVSPDPNYNSGIGDPELAGSIPYKPISNEFQPDIPMTKESVLGGESPVFTNTQPTAKFDPSTLQFVDRNTGEIKPANEAKPGDVPLIPDTPIAGESTPTIPNEPAPEPKIAAGLPPNLSKASPRHRTNTLEFADDLDKALYIIANPKTKSRSHSAYLDYAMNQTGLDEAGVMNLAKQVRDGVAQQAKGKDFEAVKIQPIGRHVKPPKTAQEVAQSLSERLQKVTEDPTNVDHPTEISNIVKEGSEVIKDAPDEDKPGIIRQILNANKALLTSGDLSAPGRQGKALILNKAWWTSLDDMFKAWGSKEGSNLVNQSIIDHPSGYFKPGVSETGKVTPSFAEQAGLELASHEEMFSSKLNDTFEKYTGVGKSSRAHTAFLNKLRSDQFASMMKAAKEAGLDPEKNLNIPKAYAQFINSATGRGNLGKLQRNVGLLNDFFFAPKNMAGQIQTWNNVLNPVKYYNYDPVLRKQALRSLFAIAGVGLGVGELARIGGAKVSNDPNSSDFRKIKIGDTRIDPFGGYQQFPVAAMKFMSGKSTSTISGKTTDLAGHRFGQQTRKDVAETFFTNRLSPLGSFIYAWMNNREFDGKPFEAKRAIYERVFPIAAKDIVDLARTDPALAAVTAIPTMFGLTGTQHYTGR